jgi:hypothetical protein
MKIKGTIISVVALMLFLGSLPADAHKINQSYVYFRVYEDALAGRFELAIKDVNELLGTNFSGEVTMQELQPYLPKLKDYYLSRTDFSSTLGKHEIEFSKDSLLRIGGSTGSFLLLYFSMPDVSEVPELMQVRYNVFFDKNEDHVGMLIIEYSWRAGILENESLPSLTFSKNDVVGEVNLHDGSLFTGFMMMIEQGIWHIWMGIDHILFLFALILPSVINRNQTQSGRRGLALSVVVPQMVLNPANVHWAPVERFQPAFLYIIKIVTFFTIAHTITLGLAALDILVLPSRFVESIIAISIALAAYHNIQPIFKGREWVIAFLFGLFHGFGFASVLSELGSGDYMGLTLFGFNLGVEVGQIGVIVLIFPILYTFRKSRSYNYVLIFGSFALIFISMYWFIERAFEYDLPLGRYILGAYSALIG